MLDEQAQSWDAVLAAARELQTTGSNDLLQQIVDIAVTSVDGCTYAGVSVDRRGKLSSPIVSDPAVLAIDSLQYAAGSGPCIEAIRGAEVFVDAPDLANDERFQPFGAKASDSDCRAVLAHRLYELSHYQDLTTAARALACAPGAGPWSTSGSSSRALTTGSQTTRTEGLTVAQIHDRDSHDVAGAATYALVGEIDLANADAHFDRLTEAAVQTTGTVRIDCTQMTFIDSSGLRMLDVANRWLGSRGRELELHGVGPECRRVFQISGVENIIRIV